MATPITEPIDIPLVLSRLVPSAEYHWRGNGYGVYDDIGEWRSPLIEKPSEDAVYAEWDVFLLERDEENAFRQQIRQTAQSAVGVAITDLTAAQRNALIVILLNKEGALHRDGTVRPLAQWARE